MCFERFKSTDRFYQQTIGSLAFLLLLSLFACKDEEDPPTPDIPNASDRFATCNQILPSCTARSQAFCLFGYKWGDTPVFSIEIPTVGPESPGGMVTYSFQESNGMVNTHRQANLPSRSFDRLPDCAKPAIRDALDAWSKTANIDFQELPDNSNSDIRFYVADIVQSGIGYPNFQEEPCSLIGGTVIMQTDLSFGNCEDFYLFVLHETGHVLGLGHVSSNSIMNQDLFNLNLEGLQSGDLRGIKELYGER